ncbi:hypothetical protein [Formosa haliotis]|uniref:hypothetical protein n=1 Tax=Formosa haliotis TaxID=1555194 RepID=UPI000826C8CD|nr:hypothetical protein [Formosa haliotis]
MKLKDLHNDNNAGFKIPKDYFNNLEDTILNEAKMQTKVTNTGFKVPENYFDTLEALIQTKVNTKQDTKVRTLRIKPWVYAASIAACLMLMFTLTFSKSKTTSFSALNTETLESFIINEDLNTSEMATLIIDTDIFQNEILQEAISDSSIDYYVENEIEIEDFN